VSLIALVRDVSDAIVRCELTHVPRAPIDVEKARAEHRRYASRLAALGCKVVRLPPEPEMPDAVFVEDVAVVVDEVAIVARPGAASRRAEAHTMAATLEVYRPVVSIEAPGTLEGGDVLRLGRRLFVGRSSRTNDDGIEQLRAAVAGHGYEVRVVPVTGCLHLKSAVTAVGRGRLLINRAWIDASAFKDAECIDVHPLEPFAANALLVGDAVIHPGHFPRTRGRLEARDVPVVAVEMEELAKAEGGVTCCSVIFDRPA